MFAGKIFEAEMMRFRAKSDMGGVAHNGAGMFPVFVGHGARIQTFFTPDYIGVAGGLNMEVNSSVWIETGVTQPEPNPTFTATIKFGAITGSYGLDQFVDTIEALFEIDNPTLYMNANANWELHLGEMRWIVNGTIAGEWGGTTIYSTMTPTPMSIPLIAQAFEISGGGNAGFGAPTGVVIGANPSYAADAVVSCGYKFLIDGQWQAWPVILPETILVENEDGLNPGGAVSATNTWDAQINSLANLTSNNFYEGPAPCNSSYRLYRLNSTLFTRGGTGVFVPEFDKSIVRLNDDYAAVIFRGGFPKTEASGAFTVIDTRPILPGSVPNPRGGPSIYNTRVIEEVHPALTQLLATVQNERHLIEEGLEKPAYSMVTVFHRKYQQRDTPISYPPGVDVVSTEYEDPCSNSYTYFGYRRFVSSSFTFPYTLTRSNQVLSYLTHLDSTYIGDRIWYLNTWASPQWSYLMWFPPENSTDAVHWKIDGAPVTPQELWLNARQQHIDHPALPTAERLKIRNHIITEPLWQNGLSGLIEANVFGQFTSWWGISRFIADPITPISSVAFDARSAPAWSSDDATLAFGAGGVTVTPNVGKSTIVVDLDVGRFGEFPFMIPHTATEISVGWNGPELLTGKASQIGAEGSAAQVTTTPGRFRKVLGGSKKYAGTWRQDYGVGYTDDTGVDLYDRAKKSMSDAIMSDNERVFSFGLLPARGFDKLRFEMTIEPTTPQPFTITFPVFHNAWNVSDLQFIREAAYFTSILTPDGPWWRYGVWTFYNPFLGLLNPPAVATPEGMPTALDWLATKRVALLGRSAFDLMYEEIATLYDVNIEWTQVKHLAADPFQQTPVTHSFVLKGQNKIVGVMVNSYSEVPPLPAFPGRGRDGNFVKQRGPSMTSYSLVTTKQWLVHPGESGDPVNRLLKPPPTPENNRITSAPLCSGYLGGYHRDVVDGSEQIDWRVRLAWNGKDVDFARVRPWHGYLWVPGDSAASLFAFRMCRDEHLGFVHAVIPSSPGVKLRSWDETKGVDRERDVTNDEAQIAGIAWSQGSRQLVVVYCNTQPDGSVMIKRTASDSQGLKWSTPEMLWEGNGADDEFDSAGREFVSYWKDGKFRIKYRRAEGEAFQGPFDIADSEDEGTTAVTVAPFAGAPVVVLTAVKKADDTLEIRRFESTSSGRTWRETT